MEAKLTVNGFGFVARYGEKDVERVLLPLLWRWTELQKERGERLVVMLAAPPGAGKSTLAAFMEWLSRRTPEATPLQAVGMDGFHYPNAYLGAHSFVDENGREVCMRSRKGAPETFDVKGATRGASRRTERRAWALARLLTRPARRRSCKPSH